jgi:uncharacterized protein (DUF1684 family)
MNAQHGRLTIRRVGRSFLIAILFLVPVQGATQTSYEAEIKRWREQQEAELTSDDGWLTLAGLFWLKEGRNSIGSGEGNDVALPAPAAPGQAGFIELRKDKATFNAPGNAGFTVNGRPVQSVELVVGEGDSKPTAVQFGSLSFTVIKRGDGYAVRLRDTNRRERPEFKGMQWFPVKKSNRVRARFAPFDKPREVSIPNVLGGSYKLTSPGLLTFTLGGREHTLLPVIEENKLFLIFRDLTSGKSTYGGGRFLYADLPQGGEVVLDFNKAYNPPCAFTSFATCPLPPRQNRLKVAINAGEKNYHKPFEEVRKGN